MNDINLLPEELRDEEERKVGQASAGSEPASWHLPGNNNQSNPTKPALPARRGEPSDSGSVLSSKPLATATKLDFKPLVPIFDLDAEAKKSPWPEELSPHSEIPTLKADQQKSNGPEATLFMPKSAKPRSARLDSRQARPGGGLLSRLFGKKAAKGKIIQNKLDSHVSASAFGKSVDVNLIPEGSDLLPNQHFYSYFIYAGAGGLLTVGLMFLGLVLYQQRINNQEKEVTAKVNASEMIYNQLKAKEEALSAWSKKAVAIQGLFDNHVYWTNFFAKLQSVTSPDVYYKDINTAVDGSVALSAVAGSYLAVAKQYLAYQQADQIIKEVAITNMAGDQASEEINFSVKLRFFPEIFFLTFNND